MNLIFLIIIINLLIIFLIYKFIFKNFTNAYKILFNLKENFKFKKYQHMFYYNENFKFKIIFQNKTYLRVNNYIFKHTKFNFTGSKKEKNTKKIILLIYANVSNYFTYKLGNVYFNRKLRKQSINLVKINLKGKNIKVEDSKNNIILKKFNINVPQKKLVLILMLDGMNSFLSNDLNYSSQFFGKKNKINSLWSNAPWTLPTFGNLITGLYTSNHQNYMARSYYSKSNSHNSQIKSEITMFEFFKNLGFVTGCYSPYPRINPTYGFDRGVDFLKYCENQTADEINDNIISQIEFCKEKNNFIFAHFLDAHHLVKNHKRVADFIFTPDDNQDYRKQDSVIKIKNQNLDTNKSKLNSFLKEKNFSEEKDIINQMKLTDFRLNNL